MVLTQRDGAPDPAQAVTALFVPGDRPDRFAKARAAGSDLVIIDLEDAVAPGAKSAARAATLGGLASDGPDRITALVRVNATDSAYFDTDRAALLALVGQPGHGLLGVMVAKAENRTHLAELAAALNTGSTTPIALIPLVESAVGLVHAMDLAGVEGVVRLAFGGIDFALDVGADGDSAVLDHARSQLVVASRAARIAAPLDSPSTQIKDVDAVARSAIAARRSGFGGKLCIHPAQLEPVRQAFLPGPAEIEWARSVVQAGDAAVQIDGQMVDRPVLARANRILRSAGAPTTSPSIV